MPPSQVRFAVRVFFGVACELTAVIVSVVFRNFVLAVHLIMSHRTCAVPRALISFSFAIALGLLTAAAHAATIGLNYTGVKLSDGIALNGGAYVPPDNSGGVGPNHVVQLINGAFAVYDKTTGLPSQAFISGRQFWKNAGIDPGPGIANLGVFNQRVLYDPASGRWLAAALTGESVDNNVLLARSDTADPTGHWTAVEFLGNAGGDGKFVDYTRLGVDANGVYISTDNFNSSAGGSDSISVFSVPKADLLAPIPTLANLSRFDAIDGGEYGRVIQPVINFGPSTGHEPLLGTSLASTDVSLFRANITGAAAAGATLSPGSMISVAPYTDPPRGAQPDGTRVLQNLDARFGANAYQVGHIIYAANAVKVGNNSGVHWVMIDDQSNVVIQEGTLSDPNFDYYQPAISANANGDIVISFNRSGFGPDGNISIFAAVGKTVGGVTTFGNPILLKASTVGNYHNTSNRWGDYTTTIVDPSDPNVFWTFQEYALASNAWGTQITQIFVPEPDSLVLAGLALIVLCYLVRRRRRSAAS
jgi:hypothetical protein